MEVQCQDSTKKWCTIELADRRLVTKTVVALSNEFCAMRTAWILSLVVSPLLVLGSPPGNAVREGGIKIGTGRGTISKGINVGRGNSGVRIGEGRLSNSTRQRSFPTTTTTTTTTTSTHFTPQSSVGNNYIIKDLNVRIFLLGSLLRKEKYFDSVKESFIKVKMFLLKRNILYL